jgi:cation diffusion facilitator CzcD-associated flavoprotein CzcO
LAGKRVLIVGAGNSGCDIACDAARAASKAFISLRRGYHFIPKHIFGKPADVFAATGPKLPMWAAQRVFAVLLRAIVGDITRLGLPKPDHRLFESHPILNDQIIHHLRHGDIGVRPDVARFDGGGVVFKDGSREDVDLVILATGYDWPVPFIDRGILDWRDERPELYLNVFAPRDERLFIMGFLDSNGGIYGVMDDTADLVARAVKAHSGDLEAHGRLRALTASAPPDISGGIQFVKSARHTHYAETDAYKKELKLFRNKLGWTGIAALAG